MITITVKYSCPECGIVNALVNVPARGEEGVIEWMDHTVIVHLSADHARRSPDCHPERLRDIMIPTAGAEKVGGPSIQ